MDYTLTLIGIGLLATLGLTLIFYWHAFFWRSWGRFMNILTGGYHDSKDIVDVNKKIEPDMSISRGEILKAKAEMLESYPLNPSEIPQAKVEAQSASELDDTTSDSGWPRKLTEEERHDPRPFRHVHIATENEEMSQAQSEQRDERDD
jgi:hypothetical protein